LFFNFGLVIVPAKDDAFRGGKPETVAEADASSGSFTPLRFVQDDAIFFNFGLAIVPAQDDAFRGGKPEAAVKADASSGSFTPLRFVQDDAFV
jgi:hypothetical protein